MSASRTPTVRRSPAASEAPTRTPVGSQGGVQQSAQGLLLGRYRLHRRLGSGAFGTVWMARDERLERDVAVKVLPRERVIGGRFEREAHAAARLSHPGIVTLYEAAVDDEGAYLVSELVSGATLAELLEAGRLSDRDIAQIGVALCEALAHAHSQGVVHRDVKPSNVLVPDRAGSPTQLAKLTDFGVARVIGGDSLTRTGDVVGTAAYMAPEQAEGRQADAAADLYSLGLVIYEALTGINPLRAGAPAQRARRLGAYLPPVRRHRRDLPRELGRAVDLALRPRPKERGSLDDLRRALASSIRALEDSPAEPVESEPDVAEPDLDWLASASLMDPAPTARLARLLAAAAAAGFAAWVVGSELQGPPLAALAAAAAGAALLGALPRLGWVILALACCASLAIEGSIGAAALVALGAVVPVLVMPTEPLRWPLAILAPALGVIGLAAAWPALAARAQSVWQRAALGAVGWIWLELASVLAGTALYTDLQDIVPGPAAWSASAGSAMHDALRPLISSGALVPALVWALAAVALPLVVRQQDLILRAGAVALWAALVLGATVAVLSMSAGHPGIGVRNALLGVLGGMAAALLVPGPFKARRGADARPRLA